MGKPTVLIVDDEFPIRNALSLKFKNAEFHVIAAGDGREALDLIREEKPDIVITDFQMPVMNGMELVRALRADESTRSVPIIMLTARGQQLEEENFMEDTGIEAYMNKPFSPREVVSKASSLIGAAR